MRFFLSIDPAYVTGKKMDYSVFLIAAMDTDRRIYMVEVIRGRWPQRDFIEQWFGVVAKYNPVKIGIQIQDWSRFFKELMLDEMRRRNVFFGNRICELQTFSPIKAGLSSKKARISRMAKYYASKSVWHLKGGKSINDLENELLAHPFSKYDDIADCAGGLPEMMFAPEKKKEQKYPKWLTDPLPDDVSGYS
jgi:hypothetical protein